MFWKNKEDEVKSFSLKDINFIYQYIVLKYDEVRYYKNLYFLLIKRRDEIFEFISIIDPDHLKNSAMLYITDDQEHNKTIFDRETNNILNFDINKEFINYLKIKLDSGMVFKRIDQEYAKLFKTKGITFFVFIAVLFFIVYIVGRQFHELDTEDIQVNLDSVFFFYDYNIFLTGLVFFVAFSIFFFKYIKHLPLMEYNFSKYYVLLKYKEALYAMILKHYIYKGPTKDPEIGYIRLKDEFYNIFVNIYDYMDKDEFAGLLFFLENPKVDIYIRNPFLKQDIINDFKNLIKVQNEDVKEKYTFFKDVIEKNQVYCNLLKMNFEEELESLKEFTNMMGLMLYIVITLIVVGMIFPVLVSAL
ncbi:hypothetical protein [Candidatus Absconditicoccus praedator]|uniref:hypothetical protein n=1 Tax=Candidatus Absconditicoccus praedator TaxID=2735562 RepID=UPI001E618958|nr:hypothetical protein [Candidatus Absconditicoccus praedator]UFX83331.1 hypothetical protein HLG78_04350 [Candidatus Absconditicoccus praedator]